MEKKEKTFKQSPSGNKNIDPNKVYKFDPNGKQKELLEKYRNYTWEIIFGDDKAKKPSINLDDYYNELYKAVGGIDEVYRGRERAGLNTGTYSEEEKKIVEKYYADTLKENTFLDKLKSYFEKDKNNMEYRKNIQEKVKDRSIPFLHNFYPNVSGESPGNHNSDIRNRSFTFTSPLWNPFGDASGQYDIPKNEISIALPKIIMGGDDFYDTLHHEITHAKQNHPFSKTDGFELYEELNELGVVPLAEIEAAIAGEMNAWQNRNKRVLMNKKDFEDFTNQTIKYGDNVIPKHIVKMIAPRIVKDDSKKLFQDLV